MHTRRDLLGTTAAAGLVAFAGCSLPGTDEETTRTLSATLDDGVGVVATTPNGRIAVEPADGDDLAVEATLRAPTTGHFDDVEVRVATSDGVATVRPTFDSDRARRETSVALSLSVPAGHPFRRADTGNGRVTVEGTTGDLEADTGNGRVTVRDVDGVVRATTGNGDVTVASPAALAGADTGNGDVTVDVPALGRETVRAETGNGDVAAALSPSLSARVEASTGNGTVSTSGLDFSDERRSGDDFSGTLGDGEKQFRAETGNGDVTLSAL